MKPDLTEEELLIYRELGEWFDKYSRWHLHSKEHEELASRIALSLVLFRRPE